MRLIFNGVHESLRLLPNALRGAKGRAAYYMSDAVLYEALGWFSVKLEFSNDST